MNATIIAALIVGIATITTVMGSVYIASYNARRARESAAQEANREKKAEIYNGFIDLMIRTMRQKRVRNAGRENIEQSMFEITSKLMVYGATGVVKAFGEWRNAAYNEQEGSYKALTLLDEVIREMRSDLGESNKGLDENDILGLIIVGGKSEIDKVANSRT